MPATAVLLAARAADRADLGWMLLPWIALAALVLIVLVISATHSPPEGEAPRAADDGSPDPTLRYRRPSDLLPQLLPAARRRRPPPRG